VSFTPFASAERPVIQIVNMWEASAAFARVCSHPRVVRIVRQLLGFDDILVWHDQMQYKPPYHGGYTGWHQDSPAWPIILPNLMISAWLPLDDAYVDNGCMWMVRSCSACPTAPLPLFP
jgi:phytanoyl-CoA hydroxylase